MALVYASICPPDTPRGSTRIEKAVAQATAEFAAYRPETVLVVAPPSATHHEAMGLVTALERSLGGEVDRELAERIERESAGVDVPVVHARLPVDDGVPGAVLRAAGEARLLPLVCSWLETRYHFDFGRAAARALAGYGRRVAVLCVVELSRALGGSGRFDPAAKVFDGQYRRAIEEWNVKWLVHVDASFRKQAAEAAVPQTAVLMGMLSESRIQPRVLAYDASGRVGRLVAAIDVLGPRRKRTEVPDA